MSLKKIKTLERFRKINETIYFLHCDISHIFFKLNRIRLTLSIYQIYGKKFILHLNISTLLFLRSQLFALFLRQEVKSYFSVEHLSY